MAQGKFFSYDRAFAIWCLPKPTPPSPKWQTDLPNDLLSDRTREPNDRSLPFQFALGGTRQTAGNSFEI
jgi:hypothetical protein